MTSPHGNEPLSALTHLVGAGLSIAGLVLLIIRASIYGSSTHVVTFTIFGVTMFFAYLVSTIYHFLSRHRTPRARRVFQIIDHIAIYFLIAGTYTPVALILLPPGWGYSLFGVVWGIALLGTIIKATQIPIAPWMSVFLYLLMGWLVVVAFVPLARAFPNGALAWLVGGGVCYTVGVIFFALDSYVPRSRWFGMHEVFHLFVMCGSFAHFYMLIEYLVYVH